MIRIESKLIGNLSAAIDRFAKHIQEEIVISGVASAARVLYDEVKINTSGSRGRPYIKTSNLYNSIYRKYMKERSSGTRKIYRISWDRRIAPHGHLIEFGTVKNPAYPFIRPAFDAKIHEAIETGKQRMGEKLKEVGGEL